jgi:hypothetical protein
MHVISLHRILNDSKALALRIADGVLQLPMQELGAQAR